MALRDSSLLASRAALAAWLRLRTGSLLARSLLVRLTLLRRSNACISTIWIHRARPIGIRGLPRNHAASIAQLLLTVDHDRLAGGHPAKQNDLGSFSQIDLDGPRFNVEMRLVLSARALSCIWSCTRR